MSIVTKATSSIAPQTGRGVWVPAFAGTTSCFWHAHSCHDTAQVDRVGSARHGGAPSSRYTLPHVHHRLALDSLHHRRSTRTGPAQCHAALADGAARAR